MAKKSEQLPYERIQEIADSIDLRDLCARYTVLSKAGNGPCPKCGGNDRFYVNRSNRVFCCRKCGFKGDAVRLVAEMESVGLTEAAFMLTGQMPERMQAARVASNSSRRSAWRDEEWQADAQEELASAVAYLRSDFSTPAREYLETRKLPPEIWELYSLGFNPRKFDPVDSSKRPCIVIPWMVKGQIMALKFRFIDEKASDKKRRFIAKGGSDSILFGFHLIAAPGGHGRVLVGIEGEFNAMTLRQVLPANYDVLSFGSEGNMIGLKRFCDIAEKYERSAVWMDDPGRIEKSRGIIPPGTAVIASPSVTVQARKRFRLDANDIVCRLPFFANGGLPLYIEEKISSHLTDKA